MLELKNLVQEDYILPIVWMTSWLFMVEVQVNQQIQMFGY